MASIPLVDLKLQHQQVAEEVELGFKRVIERTAFILGQEVRDFETAFAACGGVKHCIGVANGTDALELIVRALGLGPGDEVILPANTFIATALAVVRAGAKPVLVDSDPVHHLIDVGQVQARLSKKTRAVMAVDLYGQIAPFEALADLVKGTGVVLVEDAAQSHGARRDGRPAGSFGAAAGTSFYPGKNLGAYGDGGAVLTDSEELAAQVRALRNYGGEVKYHHPETGFNSRLDTLQAVVLTAKLRHLPRWNDERRKAARRYDELLADVPQVTAPAVLERNEHVYHLYVIRVPRRDEVIRKLQAAGVGAGIHYPIPIHLQGAFGGLGHGRGDFPVAEKAADEILSLPMFPGITDDQQQQVVAALRSALR